MDILRSISNNALLTSIIVFVVLAIISVSVFAYVNKKENEKPLEQRTNRPWIILAVGLGLTALIAIMVFVVSKMVFVASIRKSGYEPKVVRETKIDSMKEEEPASRWSNTIEQLVEKMSPRKN